MKSYVLVLSIFLQVFITNSLTIPDYLPERCKISDPKYNRCLLEAVEKAKPYLIKGVPELKLPPLDPLVVEYALVNRTVDNLVNIYAVCKNAKITGFASTVIESIRFNPKNLIGEISLTVPFTRLSMEYDVKGQLLIVPLRSKGFFQGNFTDTTFNMKMSLKRIQKDGEDYLQIEKLLLKSKVSDGIIKLTSKNPDLQFAADLIANFYNENPRLVMDAINPIYVQYTADFFRNEFNKGLINIPAKDLLPE
ncbi:circadian clock-controlled protein daywake-like [Onthophagus taurus]|uniref:circadian clock-controlled protein daywake-like n=1 Tax=Onthophagus taurus TaxID=166361 RepID=UPI000C207D9E|nr:uncharacterized protein LOC111427957 [Onthophagus taurus]